METCQEKIISLELQDPNHTPPVTPSDDEAHSIITVRNNGRDVIQLMPDTDQTTFDLDARPPGGFDKTVLRTIYEFFPNESSTDPIETTDADAALVNDYLDNATNFSSFDEHFPEQTQQQLELSLNDKMKNVLRELKQNERVRLSWSRSMTEAELEEFNNAEVEDLQSFEEKTGSNGTVFMVRERLINDFYSHNPDVSVEATVSSLDDPNENFDQQFTDKVDGCHVFENPGAFLDLERSQSARERLTLDLKSIKDEINTSKVGERDGENNEVDELDAALDAEDGLTPTTPTSATGTVGGSQRNNRKKRRGKNKKK